MTDPSLFLQTAVRSCLIASPSVIALVPAASIFDRQRRPETFPCIILGEGHNVAEGRWLARNIVTTWLDIHIWTQASLSSAKQITGPMAAALNAADFRAIGCASFQILSTRFMRDPGNELSHAVMTLEATMELETA